MLFISLVIVTSTALMSHLLYQPFEDIFEALWMWIERVATQQGLLVAQSKLMYGNRNVG
jgi:hypothetical protein